MSADLCQHCRGELVRDVTDMSKPPVRHRYPSPFCPVWEPWENPPAKRIQLRRTKGWRKPTDAVVVARPTKWGNPYVNPKDPAMAVAAYRKHIQDTESLRHEAMRELEGRDLACWCALDQPCHADVLLEIANS